MTDMRELYQETIMGHNKSPRNFRTIEDGASASGHNPLCGDKLTVFVALDSGRVADVSFVGEGCAISKASASMMTEAAKGRPAGDVRELAAAFHHLISREEADVARLGKLKVFAGVGEFPARVKCAALPWRTLVAALDGAEEPVSTE